MSSVRDGTRTFASYVYNGDGLRVQKTVDGTTTDYTYSGSYIIAETGKTYLRGLSYHAVTQSGTKYYYFSNAHGDITNVVNSSKATVAAYDYDEFGNLTEEVGTFESSFRYAGEYYDVESGNYYLRSRYYDPTIGRFTQQDSFLGYDDNPLSLNRYTYCHNNPIRFVDPSGHEARTYSRGDIIYGYDTSQFTSSEQDYQSSVWMGKYERGEINNEEFMRGMNSIGVTMSIVGGISGGYGQPSNFIPAEAVAVIFNEQLSYENSLSAASLFDSYNAGIIDDEGLKQQLGSLSSEGIKILEFNIIGGQGELSTGSNVNPTLELSGDDLNLSVGAQLYIKYYKQKWEESNKLYQNAMTDEERANAQADMEMWHMKADDIRKIDSEGKVNGNVLNVPVYNQMDTYPHNTNNNLCWATCIAMMVSYYLGDEINRTESIATYTNAFIERIDYDQTTNVTYPPYVCENGTTISYNNGWHWVSTDRYNNSAAPYLELMQKQIQIGGSLSENEIASIIGGGDPFAVLYGAVLQNGWSGHWVLGIGYASAEGHDFLVVSNDPWGGVQRIQTYDEFKGPYVGDSDPLRPWAESVIPI